ncbi:MAG TPA: DoxX family protein [Polyangiaceae bacterium]|nr:DoxX family protein [Polyangiaceae bacterium]
MDKFLGRYNDYAYAALRVVAGLLFACHGLQKVFGAFGGAHGSGAAEATLTFAWFSGAIELLGLLIALGVLTGCVAFLCSGEMAVGYFMAHAPHGFWPIQNHGELAVVYCFLFLYLATRGDGRFSVGALLRTKK